jgi:hypothetical protein
VKYLKQFSLFESTEEIPLKKSQLGFLNRNLKGVKWTWNPETNRVDVEGDVKIEQEYRFTKPRNLPVQFGVVTGEFSLYNMNLVSLKGSPRIVGGGFSCVSCNLTSLEGGPIEVGDFNCGHNQITSLSGAPKKVLKGRFCCYSNKITSLKGAPEYVAGDFNCNDNRITSLEGISPVIGEGIYFNSNDVTSLVGSPEIVNGDFSFYHNRVTSLEGGPREVKGRFWSDSNMLTGLKGAPRIVGRTFSCIDNYITSLEESPDEVGWSFNCDGNKLSTLEGAPRKVGRDFQCDNNPNLISLIGIPQIIGGDLKIDDRIKSLDGLSPEHLPETIMFVDRNGHFTKTPLELRSSKGMLEALKYKIFRDFFEKNADAMINELKPEEISIIRNKYPTLWKRFTKTIDSEVFGTLADLGDLGF